MRRKNNFNVIVTILVIILLLWFILGYNVFGIKTTINNGVNNLKGLTSNLNTKIECPEGVIPSEIDLAEYEGGLWGYEESELGRMRYYYWHPYWEDGQQMDIYPPTPSGSTDDFSRKYCEKGNEEGQNINYYYCKVGYSKTTTNISKEGEIGETKTESYTIDLVLEKKEHIKDLDKIPIDKYSIISSTCSLN